MASHNRYFCGVPSKECSGGFAHVSKGLSARVHFVHSTSEESFRCHVKWLRKRGFVRVGNREFRDPEGGIQVLTKKIRFGAILRKGKGGEKSTAGNRYMPEGKLIASF